MARPRRVLIFRISAVLFGLLIGFFALELLVRVQNPKPAGFIPLHIFRSDWPHVYELNPKHKEANEDGLRGADIAVEKKPGVERIAVLGDSVAYGLFVEDFEAFPPVLQNKLHARGTKAEVINGGVSGYTPFNEYYFYREKIRKYRPEIVILQVCLNDIIDPQLHWGVLFEDVVVPREAFPNYAEHERLVVPLLEKKKDESILVTKSRLLGWIEGRIRKRATERRLNEVGYKTIDGKTWPVYLSVENPITIEAWNADSPEWKWFREWVLKIKKEVESDGARFILLVAPLAYQLETGYPFMPQTLIQEFCAKEGIEYLDPLPDFRSRPTEKIFLGLAHGFQDIWHLSPVGHERTAELIAEFLQPEPN